MSNEAAAAMPNPERSDESAAPEPLFVRLFVSMPISETSPDAKTYTRLPPTPPALSQKEIPRPIARNRPSVRAEMGGSAAPPRRQIRGTQLNRVSA